MKRILFTLTCLAIGAMSVWSVTQKASGGDQRASLQAPPVAVTRLPPPLRDRLGTGRIVAVSPAPS